MVGFLERGDVDNRAAPCRRAQHLEGVRRDGHAVVLRLHDVAEEVAGAHAPAIARVQVAEPADFMSPDDATGPSASVHGVEVLAVADGALGLEPHGVAKVDSFMGPHHRHGAQQHVVQHLTRQRVVRHGQPDRHASTPQVGQLGDDGVCLASTRVGGDGEAPTGLDGLGDDVTDLRPCVLEGQG